jgi:hypothetical protein
MCYVAIGRPPSIQEKINAVVVMSMLGKIITLSQRRAGVDVFVVYAIDFGLVQLSVASESKNAHYSNATKDNSHGEAQRYDGLHGGGPDEL